MKGGETPGKLAHPVRDAQAGTKARLQAVGLAFARADASGHMVVLRRMFNSLECVDYQAAFVEMGGAPRYQPFPPEAHLIRFYVFNRA